LTWIDSLMPTSYRIGMSSYDRPNLRPRLRPEAPVAWFLMAGVLALMLVAVWILSGQLDPTLLQTS
jgi:hypothetical protein